MTTLRALVLILFSMVLLIADSQSKAATDIPYLTEGLPDLTGSYMDVTYNAGSDAFLASGYTTDYNTSSGDVGVSIVDSYTLSATINNAGMLTGGTLVINGAVGNGNTDVTLLTGNLTTGAAGTAFGYGDGGNELFQFLFTVNGGSLKNAFGGNGAAGGIILNAWFTGTSGDQPFTGSWASSFNNNAGTPGDGSGDINSFMMVPEPSSVLLVLVSGVLCAGAYCCRRNTLSV